MFPVKRVDNEEFALEVAVPQRARLDVLFIAKHCDRFHSCSCQKKHKAKTKNNNISITSSALSHKKEHQEATSDVLLQPLGLLFSTAFSILF